MKIKLIALIEALMDFLILMIALVGVEKAFSLNGPRYAIAVVVLFAIYKINEFKILWMKCNGLL